MTIEITETIARKVLATVDAGLSKGLGTPTLGNMCVEAAVCFALGLPHDDDPQCVSSALRSLKITLNDREWSTRFARAAGLRRLAVAQLGSKGFLDDQEFAKRVAELTIRKYVPLALRSAASLLGNAAHRAALLAAADRCATEGTHDSAVNARQVAAAYAAAYATTYATAYAVAVDVVANAASDTAAYAYTVTVIADVASAYSAAAYADAAATYISAAYKNRLRDKVYAEFAEDVVQVLVAMNAPGCQWLALTETEAA